MMGRPLLASLFLFTAGPALAAPPPPLYIDADGDGYESRSSGGDDCNDGDATINPGADEVCDSVDQDCDGRADDSPIDGTTYYRDSDRDGYGTPSSTSVACSVPSGYAANDDDCDDSSASNSPAAAERCDSVDNDCDGTVDEGVTTTYYEDNDGDSYGDPSTGTGLCRGAAGYVPDNTDCDDTNADVNPSEAEVCDGIDNNCDGGIDDSGGGSLYYLDADGDGFGDTDTVTFDCGAPSGYVTIPGDCNDGDPYINPRADEECNGFDDDCDGNVDEEGTDVWYYDDDGDGYGSPYRTSTACDPPADYVGNGTDCNDSNSAVNPAATEVCNSIDDDCDGAVDDSAGTVYYADSDRDRYGDPTNTVTSCTLPTGYVSNNSDCDDTRYSVNPDGTESCNSLDDDCNGAVDDGIGAIWYRDSDSDSYGDVTVTTQSCTTPTGYTADATDCDDTVSTTYPGADEYCNDVDDDCDDLTDEDAIDMSTWHQDGDRDGYGNDIVTSESCDAPSGYVGPGGDCWDDDASVYPTAAEVADGVDQDCDGIVDEGTDAYDDDGDGFAEDGGDCDDTTDDTSPATPETCNGDDDDCDGVIDNGTSCYDDDGDGLSEDDGDCDDTNVRITPDAAEVADNGVDDDCDGVVDDGAADPDNDGYTPLGGDCVEGDGSVHPGASETANGTDDDCDGVIDEGTSAYDDDGDGVTEDEGDCDDGDDLVNPGADDIDNGVDDDCDGIVDNGGDDIDDDLDGFSENEGDCDDEDADVSPGADETSNDVDDDCDGAVDDGVEDADADGFTVADGDCDDNEGWAWPGGTEWCDGIDNDCNGVADDGCEEEDTGVTKPGGCSCSTPDALPAIVPFALGALLTLRRRRRA